MDDHMREHPHDDLDRTFYVIGDIHGRLDALDRIVDEIHRDMISHGVANATSVTLGDYIDRGPDSRAVLDRLARNPFPTPYVALRGNHEWILEAFLSDPSLARQWRELGGLETLHSYDVAVDRVMVGRGFEAAAEALRSAIPQEHFDFLSSLESSFLVGDFFLCHAGVRPGVALAQQSINDLLWIRGEFLSSKANFGKIVIHGHTPVEWPDILPNRINIDTGAYLTGRLTCLVLDRGVRRFIFST
jgi:serine/threonine protein phosphatase 1